MHVYLHSTIKWVEMVRWNWNLFDHSGAVSFKAVGGVSSTSYWKLILGNHKCIYDFVWILINLVKIPRNNMKAYEASVLPCHISVGNVLAVFSHNLINAPSTIRFASHCSYYFAVNFPTILQLKRSFAHFKIHNSIHTTNTQAKQMIGRRKWSKIAIKYFMKKPHI